VRDWAIRYRAWNGAARTAYVVLPRWYAPHRDPTIPLVISPHGRGIEARRNLHFWGGLPALGPFALISPEGQGRVLTRYSCALRSPVHWAAAIARSGVPLHIWWSLRDRIVRNQRDESGRLFRTLRRIGPRAPVTQYIGDWVHSKEFRASARLPLALVELRLIRLRESIPTPDRIQRVGPQATTKRA
jgi:hypothetical protein